MIRPIILSGGAGTRLWPLSQPLYPKQLLPLVSDQTLLQETALRISGDGFHAPTVICNTAHRFLVAEQLRKAGAAPHEIILEPCPRSTAPAIAVAALRAHAEDPESILLVLPSDHVVRDQDAFRAAVDTAARAAALGKLVTFGITPTRPETGYGYIKADGPLADAPGAFAIERFVEKPDLATAQAFLSGGNHTWNSGMFLLPAQAFLDDVGRLQPDVFSACSEASENAEKDLDFIRLEPKAFAQSPAISIDHGIMEKSDNGAVVPTAMGWDDVGSWNALWDLAERDGRENAELGPVVTDDVSGSYIRSEGPRLAVIGVNDMVIVANDDAVLVAPRARAQDVREIARQIQGNGDPSNVSADDKVRVHRPWGWYQCVDGGDGFLVKRLYVAPGQRLSMQYHNHRAEHWVVVSGKARVTNGEQTFILERNQSTYIPLGTKHRLENPSDEPLYLVEVQSGNRLEEDDIVRLEDDYARSET